MGIDELSFRQIVMRALTLDETIYEIIQFNAWGIGVALTVVFLSGISEALGQSVVLFINRITPRRFTVTLLISAVSHLAGYLLWAATIWLIGTYLFDRQLSFVAMASVVGLAYAPRLFAFFALTPFLGNTFSLLLSLWSLLAIVVAVGVGLHMTMWQAVVASGLGWLAVQVWQRTLGRPVYAVGTWIQRRAAGVPLQFTLRDVGGLRRVEGAPWQHWKERLEQAKPPPIDPAHLEQLAQLNQLSAKKTGDEQPNG